MYDVGHYPILYVYASFITDISFAPISIISILSTSFDTVCTTVSKEKKDPIAILANYYHTGPFITIGTDDGDSKGDRAKPLILRLSHNSIEIITPTEYCISLKKNYHMTWRPLFWYINGNNSKDLSKIMKYQWKGTMCFRYYRSLPFSTARMHPVLSFKTTYQ